jgi:hypothetical protein
MLRELDRTGSCPLLRIASQEFSVGFITLFRQGNSARCRFFPKNGKTQNYRILRSVFPNSLKDEEGYIRQKIDAFKS